MNAQNNDHQKTFSSESKTENDIENHHTRFSNYITVRNDTNTNKTATKLILIKMNKNEWMMRNAHFSALNNLIRLNENIINKKSRLCISKTIFLYIKSNIYYSRKKKIKN